MFKQTKGMMLDTIIGKETTLTTKKFKSSGKVRIEGTMNGDIDYVSEVEIVQGAILNGSIMQCEKAVIDGTVNGFVINAEKIEILKNADVKAAINYKTISVEQGAILDGQIKMLKESVSGSSELEKINE